MAALYSPPAQIFGDDLFSFLPANSRPDWRWLIAGPARSGSTFHVDPNATSAWNAVVSGSKRWVLFPPGGLPPPGVHPSPDGAEVAAPVSILEWYFAFYEAAREEEGEGAGDEQEEEEEEEEEEDDEEDAEDASTRLASRRQLERAGERPLTKARRMFECTVRAGELLFVPRGWWHMALNLEEGVAVTHNFVSEETLPHVLRFLKNAAEAAKAEAAAAAAAEEEEAAAAKAAAEGDGKGHQKSSSSGSSKRHASLAQDLVSGLDLGERARLYDRFVAALREHRPQALARAQAGLDEEDAAAEGRRRLAAAFQSAPRVAAASVVAGSDGDGAGAAANGKGGGNGNGGGGFSFSFF
jgi:hypothetical protein